ncbi:MAG TPA: TIGR03435 family protein [Bryobacteraceae bacterium]|nr:TIGR03435 family protein [Bryobacteraceae bacterium]
MSRVFFVKFTAAALLAAAALNAQTPTAPLSFEVATIKPAPPINPAQVMAGKLHVGMTIDAGRVDIGYMSLADLIRTAYNVKTYQVSGPDWMNTERFDILAKIPEGGTKEQVPEMLKTLLVERFRLTLHKESKDHAMYALIVGKGGSRLKDAPPDPEVAPDAPPPGAGGQTIATNNGSVRINQNGDGRGATVTTPGHGTTKMSMGADGNMHMEASKVSMSAFAEMLSRFVDRPVVDETGLKGNYQVALDLSMGDLMRVARSAGVAVPQMGAAAGGPVSGGAADSASDPGGGGSVFTAVQALGLKLDPRKESIDTYIVDHLEKAPTDN